MFKAHIANYSHCNLPDALKCNSIALMNWTHIVIWNDSIAIMIYNFNHICMLNNNYYFIVKYVSDKHVNMFVALL